MSGLTLKPVLGCNLSCTGCYEGALFKATGKPAPYELAAIIEAMRSGPPGPATLHGGEITLMPVSDMRALCEAAREQGRAITMQTNGSIVTDGLLDMLVEYKVGVGVSLSGPGDLNLDRRVGDRAASLKMTERIHDNLVLLRERDISVGIIAVLSRTNAGSAAKLDRLVDWASDLGVSLGIRSVRWNFMHMDVPQDVLTGAANVELSPAEAATAYAHLADATFLSTRREWLPFREMVDNLMGHPVQPCWFSPCDPYHTEAVHAIFGDGSEGNCLRTAKDGIAYMREGAPEYLRQDILSQIPVADGGCGGCPWWTVCHGGCPAEGADGDWRNKSRFCAAYIATYDLIDARLRGLMPNHQTDRMERSTWRVGV